MTEIGINRKIDKLGRVVIPKEMRDFLCIKADDELEMLLTRQGILVRSSEYEVVKKRK